MDSDEIWNICYLTGVNVLYITEQKHKGRFNSCLMNTFAIKHSFNDCGEQLKPCRVTAIRNTFLVMMMMMPPNRLSASEKMFPVEAVFFSGYLSKNSMRMYFQQKFENVYKKKNHVTV